MLEAYFNFLNYLASIFSLIRYGQPPAEIISKLAPDLEFDEEGLPKMDKAGMPGMPGLPFPTGNEECTIM